MLAGRLDAALPQSARYGLTTDKQFEMILPLSLFLSFYRHACKQFSDFVNAIVILKALEVYSWLKVY